MSTDWFKSSASAPDAASRTAAAERQAQLTKPPGSLGRLEALVIELAALQGRERPAVEQVRICLFAGDHGVTEEGVSAFPQAVTVQMLHNFAAGGAAISVLARELGATLELVDCGTLSREPIEGVVHQQAGTGTANFCHGPAMDANQLEQALQAGRDAVERAQGADLFIGGDMGIGNTTAASAIACALLAADPEQLAGPGTGLSGEGVARKAAVIARALRLHRDALAEPQEVVRCLGGFEIAALAGAYVHAAQRGIPSLVDGFISSVAALLAVRLNPSVHPWLLFAHHSAESGHSRVLEALDAEPMLSLGMRLGEASGAAVAVPLLRLACALHGGMATFAEAGVADKG